MLLLTAMTLAALYFVAYAALKQTLLTQRLEAEQRALELVALAMVPDLMAGDLAKIHETLDSVALRHPWWRGLTLLNRDGARLYPLAEPSKVMGLTSRVADVTLIGRPIGRLSVAFDADAQVAPALSLVERMGLVVSAILVFGTLTVVGLQSRSVISPLRSLAEASRLMSEGRYDVVLPRQSSDEVGELVKAFQAMGDAVASREADLRRSERRLEAVIDNSAEAVLTLDGQGRILTINRAAETMFTATLDMVAGWNIAALIPNDPLGASHGMEMEAFRVDSGSFPAFVTATTVEVEGTRMVVATVADLTVHKRAEEQLKESEGRFRDLAESASDWFWETDIDYRLTFVSERIGNILGVKPSAVLGFSYFELGLTDYDPGLAQVHAEDLDAHRPFRDLLFHIGPEGGKDGKIIRISGMPFYDQTGSFIGYRGIGADITREARAEQRARQAQQQLADAIESINDGIAVFDDQDRLVLCNREYHKIFQPLSDLLIPGVPFRDLIMAGRHRDVFVVNDESFDQWAATRLATHREATGEPFQMHLATGHWLLCREYRTADGGVVGVRTDITDIKRREQDLDQLKRRYQLILDCAGDGIVGLDRDGTVTFANRMAAAMLERDPDTMIGQAFTALVEASEADRRAIGCAISDGVAERMDDALFHRADQPPMPVEYLVASLIEGEQVVGAVLVFRDITIRRQYQRALADQHAELERLVAERTEALKEAQREALHASRLASVGQLAAGIAHEINTPIQYVGDNLHFIQNVAAEVIPLVGEARKLAAELEQGRAGPEAGRDFLARIDPANLDFLLDETPLAVTQSLEGVAQVARIVLSMKEFSHPGTSQKSAVDINRALDSTLVVSRNSWKHSASVETRFDPALPLVNCHPGEMNQVFLNLIVNAAHAIEASDKPLPGTIVVETAARGDVVEISIADSGTGIADDIKDRIFDPFFTTKEVGKGTGQGLAICYDVVVTKHGGEIVVGGKPGEGAVFTIRLPVGGQAAVQI
ncbi:hypothetical protein A6A04_06110 [Paramagnetospirillum marisnigri]|uniref:histidine kinase n=1 Tax=Paramagnetospirillum marisnigri TaxID=1285242 RepID=A0A178MF48_9PROT|nr:hypothetical protein A6A04_06110 [Paramagnetospirillum marisnigri]